MCLTVMASTALLFLVLSSCTSLTGAVLFGEPRVCGDDVAGFGPIFEEEPEDVVYSEDSPGGRLSLTCRARANPPASYRWLLNNWEIRVMEQPDEHFSLVGGNLVITNPRQKEHAGTYVCVAQNIYGRVHSREARVQFGYLEEFPQDERDPVFVIEGQGAVLPCVPPKARPEEVTYRWIYNEFPVFLPTDGRRFVSQTTGNLYISKVEAQDAGNYSCFVSSPVIEKTVFSKFVPLVPSPPEGEERKFPADIRVKSPNTTAMLASNVTLECFALGNPIPDIVWRKVDATDLPANHELSQSGAVLHLYNVQYEDEGAYECEATNTGGEDRHTAWLSVESAPEWVETITNTEIDVGSEHTMNCVASGKPLPIIRWFKDGFLYGKGELKFSSLVLDDSGMYQCFAENRWGVRYANAELRVVACPPSFEFNPVKKQILGAKGSRVVIQCQPRAAPKPQYTWVKGQELLINSSRISIMLDGSLEILHATSEDEGMYTCVAENDRGKASSPSFLTITEATILTGAAEVSDVFVVTPDVDYSPGLVKAEFLWETPTEGGLLLFSVIGSVSDEVSQSVHRLIVMKLTLCVPLIWMLFSSAGALRCVQDSYTLIDGGNKVPRTCTSSDEQCLTVALQKFRMNQLEENITKRACAPSSFCNEGNHLYSFSYGDFRLTASIQCCSTDGCNINDIPFPDEQKPNKLWCLTSYPWVWSYLEIKQCMGIQDRCIFVNETSALISPFQGCASANLCEGHSELKLKALYAEVKHWAGARFSAPICCGTSLCDSAPASKLSLISLLLGLFALSVC